MKPLKLNLNSLTPILQCCVILLYGLSSAFDSADSRGFGVLAEQRQKEPRPRPRPSEPVCNSQYRPSYNRSFKVKKRSYNEVGVIYLNSPLTANFDGHFVRNLTNTGIYDPVGFFTVQGLVRRSGKYDVKVFQVTTEDSYILRLYRIVHNDMTANVKGIPVLFQHGMFGTAKDWLMLEKSGSAAISSMDAGYDVWLGNTRGTEESRDHEYFLPDDDRYWDFSVDELGRYDVKAFVDKILEEAFHQPQIFYVGHSLGTMIFYIFMHYHGKRYTAKIKGVAMIPPSAYLSNSETALLLLRPLVPIFAPLGVPLNVKLPPFTQVIHRVLPTLCSFNLTVPENINACSYLIYVLAGVTDEQTEPQVVKRMVEHYPNALSAKALVQLVQISQNDRFTMYDYGITKNVLVYQQPVPPSYDLFRINVAAFNIYGLQDLLVDRTDAERTVEAMGTTKGKTNLLVQEFNHIDLILSNYAAPTINARILAFFSFVTTEIIKENVCCTCESSESGSNCTDIQAQPLLTTTRSTSVSDVAGDSM